MRYHLFILPLLLLAFSTAKGQEFPCQSGDIVILYDNDVHGAIEGYPAIAALRDSLQQTTPHLAVVSCGDFLSGTSLGSVSRGRYIVRLMNAVGYDLVTLGNHEFDYGIPTLDSCTGQLRASTICANFASADADTSHYPASRIIRFGDTRVAFIGLTTPHAATTSTPQFFQDNAGHWLYTFYQPTLDSLLQHNINLVRSQGADYVILLSHLGDSDLPPLIAATHGVDAVLDGHSHSVIPHTLLRNSHGQPVLWTSTGSKFQYIGQLVIRPGNRITSHLVTTAILPPVSNPVADTLHTIRQAYDIIGSRIVGHSQVKLWSKGHLGNYYDSPIGNFFADAFRAIADAEIGLVNAGGIRADIDSGLVRYDNLYSAAPFDNQLCLVEMSGRTLLDALEMGCRRWPKTGGGLLHVSGLTYNIDTTMPTSVVIDSNNIFLRVDGPHRVKNVQIWDARTNRYQPLDPDRLYHVAGCDYTLLKNGDGHRFPGIRIIRNGIMPYTQILETYLVQHLHGTIDRRYSAPQGRITATSR